MLNYCIITFITRIFKADISYKVLAGLRPDNVEHLKSVNLIADKTYNSIKQEIKCTECIK